MTKQLYDDAPEFLLDAFIQRKRAGYLEKLGELFPEFVCPKFPSPSEYNFQSLLKQSMDIIRLDLEALVLYTRSSFVVAVPCFFVSLSHPEVWKLWAEQAINQAQGSGDVDQLQFLMTVNFEQQIPTYCSVANICAKAYREEQIAYLRVKAELGLHDPPPRLPPKILTVAQRILSIKLDKCGLLLEDINVIIAEYGA